ncbi:MAG: CapA family protein [Ignavibacteriae bacterium]|nr:MAG: CapA family protein [Ignavibacteriota bacterium]
MNISKIITIIVFLLPVLISGNYSYSQKVNPSTINIFFLGDFDFGESYQTNPKHNRGINIIEEYGYDYMFENISTLLKKSDMTIANLETPLLPNSISPINSQKPYVHWSNAESTIKYLKKYNIKVVSLANNHSFDLGKDGLGYTLRELYESKLDYFGAGNDADDASKPYIKQFIINKDTITIAILTGFEYRKSYDSLYDFYANVSTRSIYTNVSKPGINVISVEKISEQVSDIRSNYKNVYIIFFPHWGRNYFWKTDKQTETAHQVIDAGADLIIGHGSHMMQEVEYYNGKWIIYSIGNSIFNAPGRYKSNNVKPYSFIAELVIRNNDSDKEKHLRLYPLYTDNLETDYRVRYLNTGEVTDCYNRLKEKSIDKNIFNDEFRIKENEETQFFEIQLN